MKTCWFSMLEISTREPFGIHSTSTSQVSWQPFFDQSCRLMKRRLDLVIEFGNMVGFDVMAFGNHEFDDGVEGVRPLTLEASYSMVAANMIENSGTPQLKVLSQLSAELAWLLCTDLQLLRAFKFLAQSLNASNIKDANSNSQHQVCKHCFVWPMNRNREKKNPFFHAATFSHAKEREKQVKKAWKKYFFHFFSRILLKARNQIRTLQSQTSSPRSKRKSHVSSTFFHFTFTLCLDPVKYCLLHDSLQLRVRYANSLDPQFWEKTK